MILMFLALSINGIETNYNPTQTYEQLSRRVDAVFTVDYLNDKSRYIMDEPVGRQLRQDIRFLTTKKEVGKLDSLIISKLEEIELPTTSNTTVIAEWIQDREFWVRSCRVLRLRYEGDEENFWRLCKLAARIREIDCDTDLARRTRFPLTAENLKRRDFQMRIQRLNMHINRYRAAVLDHCRNYIDRVCRNMPEAELVTFKEKVFKIAQLGEIDRAWLFHEVEFQRKLDREREKRLIRDADGTIRVVK